MWVMGIQPKSSEGVESAEPSLQQNKKIIKLMSPTFVSSVVASWILAMYLIHTGDFSTAKPGVLIRIEPNI